MIRSLVRQLNEWSREISNEKLNVVQRGEDGNVRIVQGVQKVGDTSVVGTVYYDNDDVDRIFIGLAPDDGRPGIWISEEGQSVISLLVS
jgi:hypothetical protein